MHELIDGTIAYLKGLNKSFVFSEQKQTITEEKPIVFAEPPKPKLETAPPPKRVEIAAPKKVIKKEKVELVPLQEKGAPPTSQASLLEKIGIKPLEPLTEDEIAKRVRFAYKDKKHVPEIPILLSGKSYKSFLDNVAHAVSIKYGSSRVLNCDALESKKKWSALKEADSVKLFILPDFVLAQYPDLQAGFMENGTQRLLFGKPLLLLPDLSLYIKDPELKRSLWNIICKMLEV